MIHSGKMACTTSVSRFRPPKMYLSIIYIASQKENEAAEDSTRLRTKLIVALPVSLNNSVMIPEHSHDTDTRVRNAAERF